MTEGVGGATISTTAFDACKSLISHDLIMKIHAMTDISNGGVRGDSKEISKIAGVKLVFEEDKIRKLVNKKVLEMLDKLEIDYLGTSLDSLLIITPATYVDEIIECVRKKT